MSPKAATAASDFFAPFLKIVEARNVVLKQQSGDLHTKRPRRDALDRFNGQPPPLPKVNADPNRVSFLMVDHPSPPCIQSLDDLEPVLMSELVMDSHHRGKFLLVRLVGITGAGRNGASAGVEDVTGDVECLWLTFVCMNRDIGHVWPKPGHWFVIKEPHLTIDEYNNGNACIKIVHPSDILDARRLPNKLLSRSIFSDVLASKRDITPIQCKLAGNSSLQAENLTESLASYSEGLQILQDQPELSDDGVKRDLLRNRAYLRLELGCYEGAVADAIESLSHQSDSKSKELDIKAYLRACHASYKLKWYTKTTVLCQQLLDLQPGHDAGTQLLNKAKDRLREQTCADYDIIAITERLSKRNPRADAANFLGNTAVKASRPGRGRGLFAVCDLKPGDIILAETAFTSVWAHEDAHFTVAKHNARFPKAMNVGNIGLWKRVAQKVRDNPTSGHDLLDLHGDHSIIGTKVFEVDSVPVVDSYQVRDIVVRNAFALSSGSEKKYQMSSGVYINTSYINHSCVPNTVKVNFGDLLLLHAIKPVAKGEELSICYGNSSEDFTSKRESMPSLWNFHCDCPLCTVESKVPAAVLRKRLALAKDAESFIRNSSAHNGTTEKKLALAEKFARDIAATYDNRLYTGLPRTALIPIQAYLIVACTKTLNQEKAKRSVSNFLRTLGNDVDVQDGSVRRIFPSAHSILPDDASAVWAPLVGQSIEAREAGLPDVADHLADFARTLDRTLNGSDANTVKAFDKYFNSSDEARSKMGAMAAQFVTMSTWSFGNAGRGFTSACTAVRTIQLYPGSVRLPLFGWHRYVDDEIVEFSYPKAFVEHINFDLSQAIITSCLPELETLSHFISLVLLSCIAGVIDIYLLCLPTLFFESHLWGSSKA